MSLGADGSIGSACPFLGLQDDSESHALYARQDHVCALVPRRSLDVDWQQRFCLCPAFRRCHRFQSVQPHGVLKPLVVTPVRRTRQHTAVIFITVVVLIWLTSAVSATIFVVNHRGSAPHSVQIATSLMVPQTDTAPRTLSRIISR